MIEEEQDYSSDYTSKSVTKVNERSYKCPRCKGEFNSWSGSSMGTERQRCPFCGLVKESYEVPSTKTTEGDSQ